MGSTTGREDERPVHQVTINYSFYMGKYEVTLTQWQAVLGNNPSEFKDCGTCPVLVTFDEAQDFINKLNETSARFKYRLPTEAEWEYACRAGTTADYYAADVDDIGWYVGNSGSKTHPVGGKQPNALGLYDMSGNVWEWCRDWYHDSYNGAPTDGTAWLRVDHAFLVLRGGSSISQAADLRSANRSSGVPNGGRAGIRLVAVARTQ
jgi:formylglycine-generating enzyme required for sulfatase activity